MVHLGVQNLVLVVTSTSWFIGSTCPKYFPLKFNLKSSLITLKFSMSSLGIYVLLVWLFKIERSIWRYCFRGEANDNNVLHIRGLNLIHFHHNRLRGPLDSTVPNTFPWNLILKSSLITLKLVCHLLNLCITCLDIWNREEHLDVLCLEEKRKVIIWFT